MPVDPSHARFDEVRAIALAEMAQIAAGSPWLRRGAEMALGVPASALARSLCALDRDLAGAALPKAARAALWRYGVDPWVDGALPREGPLVVIANHPGLFDALALFTAIGRDDLATLAARRPLLEALPNVRRRLLPIDPGAAGAFALRRAVKHLEKGGALLHFPAGRIEPDPRVAPAGASLLSPWKPGLDAILASAARAVPGLRVAVAVVSGVISPRALAVARVLGRGDGLTDALVPLIQLTLPGFGDARVRVQLSSAEPPGADAVAALSGRLRDMAEAARRAW